MSDDTHIFVFVEDELSRAVALRLLFHCLGIAGEQVVAKVTCGNAKLKEMIPKVVALSRRERCLVLTDLDTSPCVVSFRRQWLQHDSPKRLLFRVAVREVESWLLADSSGLANYLSVSAARLPRSPDDEEDPKRSMIQIARRSRRREIREGVAPVQATIAKVGPLYNYLLAQFVSSSWDPDASQLNSPSLSRAVRAISAWKN